MQKSMRHNKKLWLAVAALGLFACAEYHEPVQVNVPTPANQAQQEALSAYGPLKEYVNREANPDFKLGAGVTAAEFLNRGLEYSRAVSNFDEVVTGNAFKYGSVVGDDGIMNVSPITSFVDLAREAGIAVYGHTLVWHAQQKPKYLNNLIMYPRDPIYVPVVEIDFAYEDLTNFQHNDGAVVSYVDGPDGSRALKITNEDMKVDNWGCQAGIVYPAEAGEQYKLTMMIRADDACNVGSQYHGPAFSNYLTGGPGLSFTTQWTKYERVFTAGVTNGVTQTVITLEMGHTVTSYYFADVMIERYYPEGMGGGPAGDGGHAMKMVNDAEKTNPWDVQVAYDFAQTLTAGTKYTLTFAAKADKDISLPFVIQSASYGSQLNGSTNVGTSWKEHTISFTPNAGDDIQFRINMGKIVGTVLIDDISFTAEGSSENLLGGRDFENGLGGWFGWGASNPIPELSADGEGYVASTSAYRPMEERLEILTAELDRWIGGMMQATGADSETGATTYVKAWDLVNEPMDDGDPFALKTGDADGDGTPDNPDSTDFFWQDHMGMDYVRVAARLARQYGGNDLKLFANDYNLEAVYNNNDKARGLIDMVAYWESDGVTKIDGLGTQMHVSYNVDPARQQAQEAAIVTMFQLLAATGKLVKVTELDMGINDAEGNAIPVADVTNEQHEAMGQFYKFIVTKYFELVPAAQRYGITQWALNDNTTTGGWRANSPIGLWDGDNNRKPAYAGFADGLAGN